MATAAESFQDAQSAFNIRRGQRADGEFALLESLDVGQCKVLLQRPTALLMTKGGDLALVM